MSRRIALTFVALIAALLVLAVVPLGVARTANERQSFRFDSISAARLVADAAEEYLADHRPATAMNVALTAAAGHGDCATVYRPDGSVLATAGCPAGADTAARALLAAARARHAEATGQDGPWLQVALPISDDSDYKGAVVFARSGDRENDEIAVMWTWLGLTGLGVLALGVVFAFRLARWVSRPLSALGTAAATLGDGDLNVRAPTDAGPAEVRALANTFNRMAERTQTLVHSHQVWVADVSHQLRTPLTALRLRLDVLAAESDGETVVELSGALDEIARLSRLVDGLLAIARADGDTARAELVNVGLVAAERVAAWEPVARERQIEVVLAAAGEAAVRSGDVTSGDVTSGNATGGDVTSGEGRSGDTTVRLGRGHLEQVLDNVLANALEALPDGGRVQVRVESPRAGGWVRLRVIDDGPGMDASAKAAAFHRFANQAARGNGLGLAIVYRLVSADGGEVRLLDTPGGGLTVELEFPALSRASAG